jgi:hypothetical protein
MKEGRMKQCQVQVLEKAHSKDVRADGNKMLTEITLEP